MARPEGRRILLLGMAVLALALAGCAVQTGADGKMVLKLPSEVASGQWAAKGYIGPRECLSCDEQMFTPEGKCATGKLTADFACLSCHASRAKAWADANGRRVHHLGK